MNELFKFCHRFFLLSNLMSLGRRGGYSPPQDRGYKVRPQRAKRKGQRGRRRH